MWFHYQAGLSLEAIQDLEEDYQGVDLVALASYGPPSMPRYAAIWHERDEERHHFTSGRLIHTAFDEKAPVPDPFAARYVTADDGFPQLDPASRYILKPLLVTATGDVRAQGEVGVTTTFVYNAIEAGPKGRGGPFPKAAARPTVHIAEKLAELQTDASLAQQCASFDAVWYRKPGTTKPSVRYLAVLKPGPTELFGFFDTKCADNFLSGAMDADFMAIAREGFKRLHTAVPAPKSIKDHPSRRALVAHMVANTYAPWPHPLLGEDLRCGTVTDGPLTLSALTANYELREPMVPIQIAANGLGADARFCVTWAPKRRPKPRYFALVDGPEDDPTPYVQAPLRRDAPNLFEGGREREDRPTPSPFENSFATKGGIGPGSPPPPPVIPKATILKELGQDLEAMMRKRGINNGQVAIAVDGKLKLLWSLTLGEAGWTKTQPSHRFRWGSCIKTITAARAVTLGPEFLQMPLSEALLGYALDSETGGANAYWDRLANTTIEDCLCHVSAIDSDDLFGVYWSAGRQELPLLQGDFTRAVEGGGLPGLLDRTPKAAYSNAGFVAVGEAISRAVANGINEYLQAMRGWWPVPDEAVVEIPANRALSFDANEAPVRSRYCIRRNTWVAGDAWTALVAAGQTPEYEPGGYAVADSRVSNSSGALTMSAAAWVRLLQVLRPAESTPATSGVRLTTAELQTLASKGVIWNLATGAWEPSAHSKNGGAARVDTNEVEFTWGGSLGDAKSGYGHSVYNDGRTLTFAFAAHTHQTFGDYKGERWDSPIRTAARTLFNQGDFDDDEDLFEPLGLL